MGELLDFSLTPAQALITVAIGYLLGSLPFGYMITRIAGLGDIRKMGSGNIGATNVLRTGKRHLAALTLLALVAARPPKRGAHRTAMPVRQVCIRVRRTKKKGAAPKCDARFSCREAEA